MKYWVLSGHTPVIATDRNEWAKMFDHGSRILKQEHVGTTWVSTVFLGMDHSFSAMSGHRDHVPDLFETMVFPKEDHEVWADYQERSRSWDEAMKIHRRVVRRLKAGKDP